jgi:CubicO group peptidase (beta-lactamase class C family)
MMRSARYLFGLMAVFSLTAIPFLAEDSVAGKWKGAGRGRDQNEGEFVMDLKQRGETVTGTVTLQESELELRGAFKKGRLEIAFDMDDATFTLEGVREDGKLKGQYVKRARTDEGTWSAARSSDVALAETSLTGKWKGAGKGRDQNEAEFGMDLELSGETVTGSLTLQGNAAKLEGTFREGKLRMASGVGDTTLTLKGVLQDGKLKGEYFRDSLLDEGTWSAEMSPAVELRKLQSLSSGNENASREKVSTRSEWPTARPEDMGLKSEVLDGALKDLLGANKTGAAVLVVRGKLVWEHYWDGFGPSSRFDLYSAGKAYAAAAIGLLIDDGKLKVDDPASNILTEWAGDERSRITIRNLLTMTSGLRLDLQGFSAAADPSAAALSWPLERRPGTVWSYEQATAQALCPIIQRLTGQQPIVFLRDRLLNPIGAVETDWLRSRQGDCLTWRSVLASARELALFGQLFLNKGRWNGEQLLSESFISQATTNDPLLAEVATAPGQDDFRRRGYGWLMFVNTNGIWEGVDRRAYGFLGSYHNICLVDPSREFVFVRLVTPEAQKNHPAYENALDVTDKGTARLWRTILSAFAPERFKERWVYFSDDLTGSAQAVENGIAFMKQARESGITHILITDGPGVGGEVLEEMLNNAGKIVAAAREAGITIVPGVYPIGYSGRFLGRYPELAAGIPARDVRFVVSGRTAEPDNREAPAVLNPGFEEESAGKLTDWERQDLAGRHSMLDNTVKHSGEASLKITGLEKLPASARGEVRVGQTLRVKPFHSYILSVWVKSANLQAEGEDYVWLFSGNRQRRHSYANLRVAANQDWTRHSIIFNSLEADTIDFSVGVTGARRGTLWFDDIGIVPAGFTYLVRREITPLSVKSEDGKTLYREGEDFEPLSTQSLSFGREVPAAPVLRLTERSRIRDRQALLISWFHSATIYNDQKICSVQEPRVFDLMDEQIRKTVKVWPTGALFMNYDEIRIGGWEVQPRGENIGLGQMLARHVTKGVDIIRKQAPGTKIYVWSDMFDPHHNAFPYDEPAFSKEKQFYYLCNGNWNGSWEGLPAEVSVMNWNGTENASQSLRWFAGRGHRQVIAGYYDGDSRQNIRMWLKAMEGVVNVDGMMYTTWQSDFKRMPGFFRLLSELSLAGR